MCINELLRKIYGPKKGEVLLNHHSTKNELEIWKFEYQKYLYVMFIQGNNLDLAKNKNYLE